MAQGNWILPYLWRPHAEDMEVIIVLSVCSGLGLTPVERNLNFSVSLLLSRSVCFFLRHAISRQTSRFNLGLLNVHRISVIFRVRSAKAVKITDINLLKRLGIIVAVFTSFLVIRTLVAPPVVIVGRTADDLKAYLCRTDWWDHSFTTCK